VSSYDKAKAKQFGDMHERMKYLVEVAHKNGNGAVPNDVWHAIFDLETEVRNHTPIHPPFGKRPMTLKK